MTYIISTYPKFLWKKNRYPKYYNTGEAQRDKFARVAVEINLSKPLIPHFMIDGRVQIVEYKDLPLICFHCGRYGHTSDLYKGTEDACCMSVEGVMRDLGTMDTLMEKRNRMEIEGGSELATINGSLKLGPWIHTPKRGRKRVQGRYFTSQWNIDTWS